MKNTSLKLMYRDEDNNKTYLDIVLAGLITDEQIKSVQSVMDDECKIIAKQVGLPTPSETLSEAYSFPTEADHVWTTVFAFEDTTPRAADLHTLAPVTSPSMTVEEFVNNMLAIECWDETAEVERLGLFDTMCGEFA
ncbi:hypothetical protein BM525_19255 (plasmid) [Alteromonas mediterranea]|uniref:Uncharacterized protein n=1 Tax=Alteromonas mediterranea TaxID=314275 RepID=A0AAC9JFI4_9ALTE|nr:hypothetical protein [Alteromonas mediterranea]APD92022.1 hypothetical protein BM524_19060 [Alteromonas mediterranea]APD99876.1 hypothetical protein BM525_19255 [Alteromonas mediterranea]